MKMKDGAKERLESLTRLSLLAPFDCANVYVALEICVRECVCESVYVCVCASLSNVVGILTKIRRLTFLSAANAQIAARGKALRDA